MLMDGYRKIRDYEIVELRNNGCTADDWSSIEVSWGEDSFAGRIRNVRFSGNVRLGKFRGEDVLSGALSFPCGIYNAFLQDVSLGDDCLVRDIRGGIACYDIGDNCIISSCGAIVTDRGGSFGSGVTVSVLSEAGGHEAVICDRLSAQAAWIMVRGGKASERLKEIYRSCAGPGKNGKGRIGSDSSIIGCGLVRNIMTGECARLEGASMLSDGSIMSRKDAPSSIGRDVIAEHFIVAEGSSVDDAAQIRNCFIGQACHMGAGFTAENSLFFSNCHMEKGEACAVFAGPFSVSHHKSTLLIAGMISFFNAGSGANQSNHMYKTGPIHSGTLERGTSLASGSHILWPMHTGPFSLVMGHFSSHPDTSAMPFSYLIERNGKAYLYPGINLFKAGTARNFVKWKARDGRKGDKTDCITLNQLNPCTVGGMVTGLNILEKLKAENSPSETGEYPFNGCVIKPAALQEGMEFYRSGILAYLGRFSAENGTEGIRTGRRCNPERWIDAGGLVMPESCLEDFEEKVGKGEISTVEDVDAYFHELEKELPAKEAEWAESLRSRFMPEGISEEICRRAKDRILDAVIKDAERDIALAADTGGNSTDMLADFKSQVRNFLDNR